jgi:MFS family permease
LLLLALLHFAAIAVMLLSARWIVFLGGSKSELGWFSAGILPGLVLGAPLAGRLADRIAEKYLILVGVSLVALSMLALAHSASISYWLLLWRVIQGFGHGMVFASIFGLAAHAIPAGKKAQGIGYIALAIQLGNLIGVSFTEWLLLRADFSTMYLGSVLLCGFAFLSALALPSTLSRHAMSQDGAEVQHVVPGRLQAVLAVGFFFVLGGSYGTVLQLMPLLVQDVALKTGASALVAPVMAAIFITVALCRLVLARLADGRHQRLVLIGFMLLMMLATLGWPLAASMTQLVLVAIAFALGYGLLFPGLNGLVLSHVAPAWRSRASGWVVMAFDGGFFGLLLLLGPVAEHYGFFVAFALLMGLQLLTGLAFLGMASAERKKLVTPGRV